MTRAGGYVWIIFLICTFLNTGAQNKILFPGLKNAIVLNDREQIKSGFALAFNELLTFRNDEKAISEFLGIAHDLSRTGMAGAVWPLLLRISKDTLWIPHFSDSVKVRLLSETGAASYYDNRFELADSLFRVTVSFFPDVEKDTSLNYAFSCNFLGLIQRKLGNTDSSLSWFEKAKHIRIRVLGENDPQVGAVYNNIGLLCKTNGDYQNAVYNFAKAIDIKKKAGDRSVYLNLMNLGELYATEGRYTDALKSYKQADSILENEAPSLKLADLYLNSGAVMYSLQGYQEATDYLMKALRLYDSLLGEKNEKSGKVFQNLANIYNGTGNLEEEQKCTEKALDILTAVYGSDHIEVAPLYNNLGIVYQNLRQYERSLVYLFRAQKIYLLHASEEKEKLVNTLTNIASTYKLAHQTDSAIYYFLEAIRQLGNNSVSRHPLLAYGYNSMAEIYLENGKLEMAESQVEKAVSSNKSQKTGNAGLLESCLDPGYYFESLLLSGKISWKSDQTSIQKLESAFRLFRTADTLLSLQRNFLFNKSDKITFAKKTRALVEASLDCVTSCKPAFKNEQYLSEVFRLVEKSKNLVLLQSINENQAKHFSGIPDSIVSKEEELQSRIHLLIHRIETEKNTLNAAKLQDQLFLDQKSYKNLIEHIEKNYPDYHSLKYSENVPGIREIQAGLGENEGILTYFTGDSALYRFTLTNDHCDIDRQVVSDMEDLLTGMRKGITFRLDNVFLEKAEKLYSILIPLRISGKINRLVIVPDGGLSLIPFEALLSSETQSEEPGKWPLLLNRYTINYAPSLALWQKLKYARDKESSVTSLLAFAPVFRENTSNEVSGHPSHSRGNGIYSGGLAPLSSSLAEALEADTLFRTQGYRTEIKLFSDASKSNFISSNPGKFNYIHIATHGFVNEINPGLSGLYFYPDSAMNSDNVLYLNEIYNLKLKARLVVLSACETGLGKIAAGEGILGFSRAFLYAGAENLLLSLWKVNDVSTTQLMTNFYKSNIQDGMTMAESLRKAKLSLLRDPRTSHPYFWAPFVLTGG
jgi:CHAT domain-containing protein